jgi:hypothetical protein
VQQLKYRKKMHIQGFKRKICSGFSFGVGFNIFGKQISGHGWKVCQRRNNMCGDGSLKHGNMALASTTMVKNSHHIWEFNSTLCNFSQTRVLD